MPSGLLALLAFLFWLSVTPGVEAQRLETREAELAGLRDQIDTLRGRLDGLRSRERSLETDLEQVTTELELQQMRLDEARAALEITTGKVEATRAAIADLEQALDGVRDDLARRLGGLYRLGRHGYLRLVLSLTAEGDVLPAIRQLRFLAERDRRTLDRHTAMRADLADERAVLVVAQREAEAWRTREVERRDRLARTRARHAEVLGKVTRERRRLSARTTELETKERKLRRFVGALVDGSLGEGDGDPLAGESIRGFRGVLDWPVAGEVTAEFGPRRDPRYNTEVPHNGLGLETSPGERVRTVYPGEVLYAAEFEGYGPTVVVHHPGRVFSLYAGLGLLNVTPGDMVALGDVLGAATETLYFEIRVEKEPQDPRGWLR